MNNIREKILLFLYNEYYLFWILGLTLGVYIGGSFGIYKVFRLNIIEISVIVLLLIVEIIVARRFLSDKKQDKIKLLFITIIPFFILLLIGNLLIFTHELKESKNVLLTIYEDKELTAGNIVVLEGRVSNHPVKSYDNLSFMLAVEKVAVYDRRRSLCGFFSSNEFVKVRLNNSDNKLIVRDDHLQLKGNLTKNNLKKINSSKYNELIFLADCRDSKKIKYRVLGHKIFIFRSRLYNCLKNAFYKYLKREDACIAEALILGNRNNIPTYIIESFKKCGAYHLFAISGLHLSFFILLIYLIFKKIRSSTFIFWTVIIFLIIYNFLVGERASILRASITGIFILLARNWKREFSYKNILYLSYIIIIIYSPYFLYDLGFWMTYGSMIALVFVYPVILRLVKSIIIFRGFVINFIIKILFITLSIQVVLFPILIYFFKEVSLVSPLTNAFVIPAFYILLAILIVSSFVIIIWPPAGGFILRLSTFFFEYILRIVKIFSKFNYCVISLNSFKLESVLACYAVFLVILVVIYIIMKKVDIKRRKF